MLTKGLDNESLTCTYKAILKKTFVWNCHLEDFLDPRGRQGFFLIFQKKNSKTGKNKNLHIKKKFLILGYSILSGGNSMRLEAIPNKHSFYFGLLNKNLKEIALPAAFLCSLAALSMAYGSVLAIRNGFTTPPYVVRAWGIT